MVLRLSISLVALAVGSGCAALPPAKQAKLDLLECRAQALAPAVEPLFDAVELAREIYLGRASLPAVLKALNASEAEVRALVEALDACNPPPASGPVEPG
jgi:hypothetical protein